MSQRPRGADRVPAAPVVASPPTILVFLAADFASFLLFFLVFMTERLGQSAAFDRSAASLNVGIGLANTLVLLTSGLLLAMAVRMCVLDERRRATALMTAGIAVASSFVILKVIEYAQKFHEGINVGSGSFFAFYFVLTGLHLFHVLAGIGVLIYARRCIVHVPDANLMRARVTSSALYWHLVDLLWVFMFPMFYLQVG